MKRLAFILLLFNFGHIMLAQDRLVQAKNDLDGRRGFISGVEVFAGLGLSYGSGSVFTDSTRRPKLSSSLGIGVIHMFNRRFGVDARFMWEMKGVKQVFHSGSEKIIYDLTNQYATLYLVPSYSFGRSQQWMLALGWYEGILRKTLVSYNDYDLSGRLIRKSSSTSKQNLSNIDTGWTISIGRAFKINKQSSLCIRIVCNRGHENIYNNPSIVPSMINTISILTSYKPKFQ